MKIAKYLSLALAAMTLAFTSCEGDKPEWVDSTLKVQSTENADITALTFEAAAGEQTFNIISNRSWIITTDKQEWFSVTPEKFDISSQNVDKTTAVKVSLLANDGAASRKAVITITAEDLKATLTITQNAEGQVPVGEVLYSDNFDKKSASEPWPSTATDSGDYCNPTGSASSTVTYEGANSQFRSNSPSDNQYSGYKDTASGGNNVFFQTNGSFAIQKIDLASSSSENFTLTFGCYRSVYGADDNTFIVSEFHLLMSGDGEKWTEVKYTRPVDATSSFGTWNLATASFSFKEKPAQLYIKFTSDLTSSHRMDDVTLYEGGGGTIVDLAAGTSGGSDPDLTETTIADINADATTTATAIGNYFVKAVVTSDFAGGNYASGNLMVMTKGATAAGNGIMVYLYGADFTSFAFGDEVKIDCSSAKSQKYNKGTGAYCNEIIVSAVGDVTKTGNNYASEITPVTITPDQIEAFQGMVVAIADSQAKDTSIATWAGKTTTFVSNSVEYPVYVQDTATSIVGQPFLNGKGTLKGIAYVYGGGGTAQICPRNYDDVSGLTEGAAAQSSLTVTPATISWEADNTDEQTITVAATTAEGVASTNWEASIDDDTNFSINPQFMMNRITVTPKAANASSADLKATITVTFDGKTKTIALTQKKQAVAAANTVYLTNAEIEAAGGTSTSYADCSITSASGVWTGNAVVSKTNKWLQMRSKTGSYMLTPVFSGNVVEVKVNMNAKTVANRNVYIMPADTEVPTGDYVQANFDGNLAVATTTKGEGESETLTLTPTANVNQFKIMIFGGAVYIDSIEIALDK